jgi:hyperosmotically inducible protein
MSSSSKVLGVLSCLILTCVVGLTGCQSTTGKTAGETLSDASISTAVQAKLTRDQVSNFPRIDVDTDRGVVNLSGVVETETQRAQAAYLAKQVRGVVMVNNNLQIQNRPPAGKSSSAEIRETVNDKDPLSGGGNIDPSSKMDAQTSQSK